MRPGDFLAVEGSPPSRCSHTKKTTLNVLATLSSIMRTAKAWDYACGDFKFADLVPPRDGVRAEQRCFTGDEMRRVIVAAPEWFGTIVAVTAILGLRIGGTLALRVSDVDFDRRLIRVRQSVDSATRKIAGVKSKASSTDMPMPKE